MAYYAKLGPGNVVLRVDAVDNDCCIDSEGNESEDMAINHLTSIHGNDGPWIKCSYNTCGGFHVDENKKPDGKPGLRANFPGGRYEPEDPWYYNSEYDIFHKKKPENCESWTLNTTTGYWDPPMPCPEIAREDIENNKGYIWDEELYQSDNAKGWVLITP